MDEPRESVHEMFDASLNRREYVTEFMCKHDLDEDSEQYKVLVEEVGELGSALLSGDKCDIEEEVCDVLFVARLISVIHGLDDLDVRYNEVGLENVEKNTKKDGKKITKDKE